MTRYDKPKSPYFGVKKTSKSSRPNFVLDTFRHHRLLFCGFLEALGMLCLRPRWNLWNGAGRSRSWPQKCGSCPTFTRKMWISPRQLMYFIECGFCYRTIGIPLETIGTSMDLGKSAEPKQLGMSLDTTALEWNRLPNFAALEVQLFSPTAYHSNVMATKSVLTSLTSSRRSWGLSGADVGLWRA